MAQIYSFQKRPNEVHIRKTKRGRAYFLIDSIIFGLLSLLNLIFIIPLLYTFIVFLTRIKLVREMKESFANEEENLRKFATLPSDTYVFQFVPIEFNNWAYTVEYLIVTPRAIFTVYLENTAGRYEGTADSDSWTVYTEK